jgi:hypothetical protein
MAITTTVNAIPPLPTAYRVKRDEHNSKKDNFNREAGFFYLH